jgi:hypothetical protein
LSASRDCGLPFHSQPESPYVDPDTSVAACGRAGRRRVAGPGPGGIGDGASRPSYDTLLERLDQLPGTRVGTALAEAADARADQARALPNPSLSYSAENAWGSGTYRGMGKADTVLTLSQPLEVWGQRGARVRAARPRHRPPTLRGAQSRSDVPASWRWSTHRRKVHCAATPWPKKH